METLRAAPQNDNTEVTGDIRPTINSQKIHTDNSESFCILICF
jgi:hypothetical protein